MWSDGSRAFAVSNVLTKCLELLEKTKNSPVLFRELCAIAKKQRIYAHRCVSDILRQCRNKPYVEEHQNTPKPAMLLFLYSLFPDLVDLPIIEEYFARDIADRTIHRLLLKVAIGLVEKDAQICLDRFIERHLEEAFGQDAEIDYVFLDLVHRMSEKGRLQESGVRMLERRTEKEAVLAHVPKLALLAGSCTFFRFKLPKEALDGANVSLYIRTMDALVQVGTAATKERLLELLPMQEAEFARHFSAFLEKTVMFQDYTKQSAAKKELFSASPLFLIRKAAESDSPPEECLAKIRRILRSCAP